MDSGSLPLTDVTSSTAALGLSTQLDFGLSSKDLSTLAAMPKTESMSDLPGLSTQTTYHTSTSPATTLMDSHASIDLAGSTIPGIMSAADEFNNNKTLILDIYIPRVQKLASTILHDITRCYESEGSSVQAATNITHLKASLMELHSVLRQSGIGSLPISFSEDRSATIGTLSVEEATANVGAAYNRVVQCRENASIVQHILEQETPTRRS